MPTPLPTAAYCEVVLDGPAEYDRADFELFTARGGAIRTNGYPITLVGPGLPKQRMGYRRGDVAKAIGRRQR
jgi:hypothetical protein